MTREPFEQMLTGGHPNSLGRTVEVVETVLADRGRIDELFACYRSNDEVVRLRVSNAFKRICSERPEWILALIDRFLGEITALDQASAQWTLSDVFRMLGPQLSPGQRERAAAHMRRNLTHHTDWIVLNSTMKTLAEWARDDPSLRRWLVPELERLSNDPRKSVSGTARKVRTRLG